MAKSSLLVRATSREKNAILSPLLGVDHCWNWTTRRGPRSGLLAPKIAEVGESPNIKFFRELTTPTMDKVSNTPVLILGLQLTGLATARCLADTGIQVQVASFRRNSPMRHSTAFEYVDASNIPRTVDAIGNWLLEYSATLATPPVVFATSDIAALALAKYREQLTNVCYVWNTEFSELEAIISKRGLYERAREAGVNVPPVIVEPNETELTAWCTTNKGPYLVKPFYSAIPTATLGRKNLPIRSDAELQEFVRNHGAKSLIVQKLIVGGDGWVYDCYGLCNREFRVVTQATHKRLRQFPKNFGTTSYGEIPATTNYFKEQRLFELTNQLLSRLRYHGVFGIEWIEDRENKDLYLIDFNARPFLSIGHLNDCGLNLPALAYRDMLGTDLGSVPRQPKLKHKLWICFDADRRTIRSRVRDGDLSLFEWLKSLFAARSFACWRITDPYPAVLLLGRSTKFLLVGRSKRQ